MKYLKKFNESSDLSKYERDPKDYVDLEFIEYVKDLSMEYLDDNSTLEITANISVETFYDKPSVFGQSYMSNWPIFRCIFSHEESKEEFTKFDMKHLGIYYKGDLREKYVKGLFEAFDDIRYEIKLKGGSSTKEQRKEFYQIIRDVYPQLKITGVI